MPKIILTRPKAQALDFANALQAQSSFELAIEIAPLVKLDPLDWTLPDRLPHVIITSGFALRMFIQKTTLRPSATVVGTQVADLARENGFDVVASYETVEELIEGGIPTPAIYLRGEIVTEDLCAHSKELSEAIIYRQTPLKWSPRQQNLLSETCILPVFSRQSAYRILDLSAFDPKRHRLVAISPTVADILRQAGGADVLLSAKPNRRAMIDAILRAFN